MKGSRVTLIAISRLAALSLISLVSIASNTNIDRSLQLYIAVEHDHGRIELRITNYGSVRQTLIVGNKTHEKEEWFFEGNVSTRNGSILPVVHFPLVSVGTGFVQVLTITVSAHGSFRKTFPIDEFETVSRAGSREKIRELIGSGNLLQLRVECNPSASKSDDLWTGILISNRVKL